MPRRPGARRRARRRRRRPRTRDRGRRGAALRRGGDPGQGARRAARCAGDDDGPVVATACAWAASTATRRSWSGSAARAPDGGLGDRVRFPGPRTGADLDRSYAAADLLVLASRAETYGMVVTEALARGLPVVAAEVGGVTGGARPRRRRDPARAARPARRPCGTRRRAPGLARRRRAARAVAPGRPRAARVALRVVDHHVRPSQASWPGRRDDRRGHPGQPRTGSPSASLPTPRPVRPSSSNSSRRHLPATRRR